MSPVTRATTDRPARGQVSDGRRRIGAIGTVVRVVGGILLLVLAFADMPAGVLWGLEVYELVLGLVVFPGATVGSPSSEAGRQMARCG